MRRLTHTLGALMLALTLATPALAQDTAATNGATPALAPRPAGDAAQLADQISNEIFSPFCPGKTLDMCPSPNAATVRRDIHEMSREGFSREQIKTNILAEYGEEFRIVEPPAEDNNGLLAALGLGLLFAIAVVFFLSRKRKDSDGDDEPEETFGPIADEDQGYLSELREDLDT